MKIFRNIIFLFIVTISFQSNFAQKKKVQPFGGFGLSINSQFFSVSLQPGLKYNLSDKFQFGIAAQYSYAKSNRNYYGVNFTRHMYGGNLLAMYHPISDIEVSAEYELLKINEIYNSVRNNYLSPALFGGVGYYSKNFVVGFKFNFLQNDKSIYKDALVPFVRIYL